jgi:PAS domain S-box-containing protein
MANDIAMSAARRMQRSLYSLRELFRRGQLKIGARLTLSFVAIVLLMTAGDVVAVWQFGRIETPARRFYRADQKALAVIRVHLDIVALRDRLAALASAQDAHRFAVEVVPLRKSFLEDVERAQQALRADVERDPAILSTLETVQGALPSQIDSMLELAAAGDWQAVRFRLTDQLQALIRLSSSLVDNVDLEVAQERAKALENTQRAQRQLFFVLPVTALLTLLIAIMLGWHATRSITGPLSQLDAGAQALARGEFQHRVEVTGKDELARLGRVFNDAAQQLRDLYDALKHSEERYRSIILALSEGIVFQDASGKIVTWNNSAQRTLGWTKDMEGRTSMDPRVRTIREDGSFFPGDAHPAMVTLRTGRPTSNVVMGVYKPDGTLSWISINSEPLFHKGEQQPYAVVTSFTDITGRKRAEEGLRQSQEKYRVFFEQNLAGSYISTPDGVILACNPAFLRIFGRDSEEDAKATNLGSLYPSPADRKEFLQQLRQHGQLDNHDREYRRKDGAPLYVRENARGAFDENGELIEIHGFLVDETERKRAEQQLWQAQKAESGGNRKAGRRDCT